MRKGSTSLTIPRRSSSSSRHRRPRTARHRALRIGNLPAPTLGLAAGHTIWLDDNAAGRGWFVDATPWDDSEFATPGDQGEQGKMDLLTALAHEIGHLLDQEHEADGLMAETLTAGTRLAPVANSHGDWLAAFDVMFTDDGLAGKKNRRSW